MEIKYRTILTYGEDEVIINKSRFIGYAKPVNSEEEALSFIEDIREMHRKATHNCYAYKVDDNGVIIQRYSDDGEPGGTAGLPMISLIEKEDLINLVVVVTRYFGGIKLGASGLVRAYTDGAKIGIEAGTIVDICEYKDLEITLEYENLGKIENYLTNTPYKAYNTIYEDKVKIYIYIRTDDKESFLKDLNDLTSGNIEINQFENIDLPTDSQGRIIRRKEDE